MSNYHILDGITDGNRFRVAIHVAVPNTNNLVSVNYRTALRQLRQLPDGTFPKSAVPFIQAAEQTQLDNGELIEEIIEFNTHPGQNLAQKQAALDAAYSASIAPVQAKYANILQFWGYSRDVP